MSDPTKTPGGNRPPRVFRPFTSRQSEQEISAPPTPPKTPMARRTPASPRPFFGRPAQPTPRHVEAAPPPVLISSPTPVQAATVPVEAAPATQSANAEQEAWKAYLGLPSDVQPVVLAAEPAAIEGEPDVTPAVAEPRQAPQIDAATEQQPITVEVPIYEDAQPRIPTREVPAVAEDAAPRVVTRELPTVSDEVSELTEPSTMLSEPEPDVLEAPRFVAPASELPAESLIDEVDAAFITSGLPASRDRASDEAKRAAATLESIAQRLRAGHVHLGSSASANSDESVLASVLAALLAKR